MNPQKVKRAKVRVLEDLPNIGKAMAADLRLIGIHHPEALRGKDPLALYRALCEHTGAHHDPCVADVFFSVVDFMEGSEPQPWWHYTAQRKRRMADG